MSALAQPSPPLSVRTQHKFRKLKNFLHQKVWTSAFEEPPFYPCPHWTNSLFDLTADVFYEQLLKVVKVLKVANGCSAAGMVSAFVVLDCSLLEIFSRHLFSSFLGVSPDLHGADFLVCLFFV